MVLAAKKSTSGVNFLQISQLAPESESESDSTNEFTPHHSISDQPHPSPAVSLAYMYPPTATPSLTSYLPNHQVSSVPNTSSNIFPSSSTTIHSIHQSTSPPLHQLPTLNPLQPDCFSIFDPSTLFPLNQIPYTPLLWIHSPPFWYSNNIPSLSRNYDTWGNGQVEAKPAGSNFKLEQVQPILPHLHCNIIHLQNPKQHHNSYAPWWMLSETPSGKCSVGGRGQHPWPVSWHWSLLLVER